jgi:hypothetical protein
MSLLRLDSFTACLRPAASARFEQGRIAALRRHGCAAAASETILPGILTHYVTLTDVATDVTAGGVCLAIKEAASEPFAIETVLRKLGWLDPHALLDADGGGIGELSALWMHADYSGRNLSYRLLAGAMELALSLGQRNLITLCSPHMIPSVGELGFHIDKSYGDSGLFPYPNRQYLSAVMRYTAKSAGQLAGRLA